MIGHLLYRLSGYLPCRIISNRDGAPYLERYFVARIFGLTVYLHRFLLGDEDKDPHNHPWTWAAALVLSGGYHEARVRGIDENGLILRRRRVRPGRINWIGPSTFHRVDLEPGTTSWSLFLHPPHCRTWGFLRRLYTGGPGALVFHRYQTTTGTVRWWKTAPPGRKSARLGPSGQVYP